MELIPDYEKAGFLTETDYFSNKKACKLILIKQKSLKMNLLLAFCFIQTVFG